MEVKEKIIMEDAFEDWWADVPNGTIRRLTEYGIAQYAWEVAWKKAKEMENENKQTMLSL